MKKILIFILLFTGIFACNKTVYIPVETVRTEYRDNYLRDCITVHEPQGILRDRVIPKNRFSADFQRADAASDSIHRYRMKVLRKASHEAAKAASGRVFKRDTLKCITVND